MAKFQRSHKIFIYDALNFNFTYYLYICFILFFDVTITRFRLHTRQVNELLLNVTHVTWSAQEVHASKIDHTNTICLHILEPGISMTIVQWVVIKTHTHTHTHTI